MIITQEQVLLHIYLIIIPIDLAFIIENLKFRKNLEFGARVDYEDYNVREGGPKNFYSLNNVTFSFGYENKISDIFHSEQI